MNRIVFVCLCVFTITVKLQVFFVSSGLELDKILSIRKQECVGLNHLM